MSFILQQQVRLRKNILALVLTREPVAVSYGEALNNWRVACLLARLICRTAISVTFKCPVQKPMGKVINLLRQVGLFVITSIYPRNTSSYTANVVVITVLLPAMNRLPFLISVCGKAKNCLRRWRLVEYNCMLCLGLRLGVPTNNCFLNQYYSHKGIPNSAFSWFCVSLIASNLNCLWSCNKE